MNHWILLGSRFSFRLGFRDSKLSGRGVLSTCVKPTNARDRQGAGILIQMDESTVSTPPQSDLGRAVPSDAESASSVRDRSVFLQFYYPELKDLGKHFLTLV